MRSAERVIAAPLTRRAAVAHPARRVWSEQGALYPYLYLAPFLVFFIAFEVYPIFQGLWVSLNAWDLLTPPRFVGLANYTALVNDGLFLTSLRNTFLFVLLDAPLAIVIPLVSGHAGQRLHPRPDVLPQRVRHAADDLRVRCRRVVAVVLQPGVRHHQLRRRRGRAPWSALAQRTGWATFAIVITTVWWTSGFNMVLFLAGLQNIPEHLYDAAKVDGAGSVEPLPPHHAAWPATTRCCLSA